MRAGSAAPDRLSILHPDHLQRAKLLTLTTGDAGIADMEILYALAQAVPYGNERKGCQNLQKQYMPRPERVAGED